MPFLESNMAEKICYKVFYSQVLRYQRLSSYQVDFEDRVRLLADILLRRRYERNRLARELRQVIGNYRSEFERWSIPADSQLWFNSILLNHTNNISPTSYSPLSGLPSFSQPVPDNIGPRFNTFSQ